MIMWQEEYVILITLFQRTTNISLKISIQIKVGARIKKSIQDHIIILANPLNCTMQVPIHMWEKLKLLADQLCDNSNRTYNYENKLLTPYTQISQLVQSCPTLTMLLNSHTIYILSSQLQTHRNNME